MTGISRALFDVMDENKLELGLYADYIHSFDLLSKSDKVYFIDEYFPVYRLGSGITSKEKKDKMLHSLIKVVNYFLENRAQYLDKQDRIYLKKVMAKAKLKLNKNYTNKILFLKYYLLSFGDVLNGYTNLKTFLFEISIFLPDFIKNLIKKIVR